MVGLDGVEVAVKKIVYRNKDLKFQREKLQEEGAIRYRVSERFHEINIYLLVHYYNQFYKDSGLLNRQ